MANKDNEGSSKATSVHGRADLSAQVNLDNKSTQGHRGNVMASLKVVAGPGVGSAHTVYRGDNAIGRSPQNRIALDFGDDAIHREAHAWIHAQSGEFVLEHGGKTNPVYLNGQKISGRHPMKLGDKVGLGSTTLQLDPA